ncbi:MAG: hypothetical protein CVT80_06185 [Alphaproteobacteria bacterium HGW-Alphaproteobacteria-2]|nr:MAG: hypothetical protein CVT80_06185 [Alphaproteobacteria bacterium HGW-Alphaproteobacteria-2]
MDGRQRVVIHAGFHKTGTTTAQQTLHANGPVLWPVMALGLRWRLKPVLHAARAFSTLRDDLSLIEFTARFDEYLDDLDIGNRGLLIASEELCGHLPGRGDIADYAAAPVLMRRMADVLERRFGDVLDLAFLFTLRRPSDWLESAWAEHVKSSRMTLDFEAFRARLAPAADLPGTADRIRAAVAPHPVETAWIEDTADTALGPVTPLLDLMRLAPERRARIIPQPRANTRLPAAVLAEMLEINRCAPNADDAKAAKAALVSRAGMA